MTITASMKTRAMRFEGNVAHLYLDTAGNVTVGVGRHLPTAASAQALPFVRKADGKVSTGAERKAEWETIKQQAPGKLASYYETFGRLRLDPAAIDSMLTEDLTAAEAQLKAGFDDYDRYPVTAREGLVDMCFNLGIGTLTTKFPRFVKAVKERAWQTAAAESHRPQLSAERNADVKKLFEDAGR